MKNKTYYCIHCKKYFDGDFNLVYYEETTRRSVCRKCSREREKQGKSELIPDTLEQLKILI